MITPFSPRPTNRLGIITRGDWRVKCWSIVYGPAPFDRARFDAGIAMALDALPPDARTPERPGLGVIIAHQGNGADYVVLAWWDRENELPLRVFVREQKPGSAWRPAQGSESICVWDLEVLWKEREAYVTTVLARGEGARDDYLTR